MLFRSSRFKAFGFSYKFYGEDRIRWVSHNNLAAFFDSVDWSVTALLAHNAQFDVAILSWVYGHKPCFIFDSLSMARALRGVEVGNSLAQLADEFGLPPKGKAVHSTDGLEELPPEIEKELADYCCHDVALCEGVFNNLIDGFPTKELRLIDLTLRMFTDPVLRLDKTMLEVAIKEEAYKRGNLLRTLGIDEKQLASNEQFADILRGLGVEPPMKKSKTTGEPTLALAKNDAHFQALLNSERDDISVLCEARLAVKSTLERTRAQRFLDIANRGTLPVPLNYYGAHTGRWAASKGSGINMQNMKRGSFLRKSILAPDGCQLVVCDLSQIEPRVLAYLTDYEELLDIFRSGEDAYSMFGRQMFGIPDLNKKDHPELRQSAKSALLGAGYGLGWASFAAQLLTGFLGAPPTRYDKAFAKQLGVTSAYIKDFISYSKNLERMGEIPHTCTQEELLIHCVSAKLIIDKYRAAATPVKEFWGMCDALISRSLVGGKEYVHKCFTFQKGRIVLPSGLALRYPQLKGTQDERGRVQWTYGEDDKKLYGGKLTENIVQAVARCVMTDQMLRMSKRYKIALTVHDECCMIVPEAEAEEAFSFCMQVMSTPPSWIADMPTACDGGYGVRYGDIK